MRLQHARDIDRASPRPRTRRAPPFQTAYAEALAWRGFGRATYTPRQEIARLTLGGETVCAVRWSGDNDIARTLAAVRDGATGFAVFRLLTDESGRVTQVDAAHAAPAQDLSRSVAPVLARLRAVRSSQAVEGCVMPRVHFRAVVFSRYRARADAPTRRLLTSRRSRAAVAMLTRQPGMGDRHAIDSHCAGLDASRRLHADRDAATLRRGGKVDRRAPGRHDLRGGDVRAIGAGLSRPHRPHRRRRPGSQCGAVAQSQRAGGRARARPGARARARARAAARRAGPDQGQYRDRRSDARPPPARWR